MTGEELFLLALEDLEERLQLTRRQYDVLCASSLLRKLLWDGKRSLLPQVCEARGATVTFTIRDWPIPDPVIGNIPLAPDSSHPTLDLALGEFLERPALGVGGHNPHDRRWRSR